MESVGHAGSFTPTTGHVCDSGALLCKVTFSNFLEISKPEPGSSVIRGESAEAIHLYSSNHKHFCSVQACLVTSDVSDSLRPYGL